MFALFWTNCHFFLRIIEIDEIVLFDFFAKEIFDDGKSPLGWCFINLLIFRFWLCYWTVLEKAEAGFYSYSKITVNLSDTSI